MKRYRVWWSIADDWGASWLVVNANSKKEARQKVHFEYLGRIVIPEWLQVRKGSNWAVLHAEVDDVEELSD